MHTSQCAVTVTGSWTAGMAQAKPRTDVRNTRKWQELRKRIIARDGQCAVCGSEEQLEVDHIIPYSVSPELGLDPDNLQVLCRQHNRDKSDRVKQRQPYINTKWTAHPKWKVGV